MKTRRLGLFTTINTNIGDDFIREGILRCIRGLMPADKLELVTLNKHDPLKVYPPRHPIRLIDKYQINQFKPRWLTKPVRVLARDFLPRFGFTIFESCDVLIQCGTPILWQGCRDGEWARSIWQDVFARLAKKGKPLLNLGGGACYPIEQLPETLVGNRDETFARLMLDSAQLTTVRDKLAHKLFSSVGGKVHGLCCPALLAAQAHVSPAIPTRKVIVNYMQGGGHYDWGQAINAQSWERTMRQAVRYLEQLKWQPLLVAHNQKELALAEAIWPDLPRICPKDVRDYFEVTRDAAFGVVNRMHASVGLAGLGIPSVAIGTDSRNFMVEQTGLPVFYVKEATIDRMVAAIDDLCIHREIMSRNLLDLQFATLQEYSNHLQRFFNQKTGHVHR